MLPGKEENKAYHRLLLNISIFPELFVMQREEKRCYCALWTRLVRCWPHKRENNIIPSLFSGIKLTHSLPRLFPSMSTYINSSPLQQLSA